MRWPAGSRASCASWLLSGEPIEPTIFPVRSIQTSCLRWLPPVARYASVPGDDGEGAGQHSVVPADRLRQRHQLAGDCSLSRIEPRGHERVASYQQQAIGRHEHPRRLGGQHAYRLAAVERPEVHALSVGATERAEEYEPASIGEKLRPPVAAFARPPDASPPLACRPRRIPA